MRPPAPLPEMGALEDNVASLDKVSLELGYDWCILFLSASDRVKDRRISGQVQSIFIQNQMVTKYRTPKIDYC